jgi:TIR domain
VIQSPKGVFLSYASEDAGVAKRICDALRIAGIEAWFDQSELRGGDAWDQARLLPGEYKYMTQGIISLQTIILTFTILTNDDPISVVISALDMLRGAVHVPAGSL